LTNYLTQWFGRAAKMILWFSPKKAVQAAAILLDFEQGKMEYLRLLKLLYIADRESIKETGRPITFSSATAMDNGPLSSEIYDLIKGTRSDAAIWSAYVRTHGCDATLVENPGRGELSKYEIVKLNEVSQKHEQLSTWDLARKTHGFTEWKSNKPKDRRHSKPIPFPAILDALGFPPERKQQIIADLQTKALSDRLFAGAQK
jgi:uncharacterized phage-associated protein